MLKKIEELHDIKNRLIDGLNHMTDGDLSRVSTAEVASIADSIKDLAEAEEKCWKACYYEEICCAMMDEAEESGRYGYDNWRNSSGRFSRTGTGHFAGHGHTTHKMGYHDEHMEVNDAMMGIKEAMKTADPDTKRRLKTDLANLLGEMP